MSADFEKNLENRKQAIEALPSLRQVIDEFSLNAQKSLGQNFLLDRNVTDKIVRLVRDYAGGKYDGVNIAEIGPGPGGLTRSLLLSPARSITAIEFDRRVLDALQNLLHAAHGDLTLNLQDALKVDLCEMVSAPRAIVANLPYNIATPLLIGWLQQLRENHKNYEFLALMFQREVADRITAQPNTKSYGRLSIIAQWLCKVHRIYDLPPSAFTPPPKVDSAVVFFAPKELSKDAPLFNALEQVTANAFNQRRKMIRVSLKSYLPIIEKLGIDPQKRAENLTVEEFVAIAKAMNN